ncbi:MAG TPA: MBL fold metallo-hydrolase [Solirubrobacteraceae bacterium]|nr:MBL fold metallo-hydrolase [Solirubrobacteraceae bacterium]
MSSRDHERWATRPVGRRLAQIGIHPLAVPTPFAIGAVNAYLLAGDPVTLIDTGPNLATSLVALSRLLAGVGYAVEDIEVLVITHTHADHLGLTALVAERAGAEVCALDRAASFIENVDREMAAEDDFAARLMRRHGIDQDVTDALRSVATIVRGLAAPAAVTRPLSDGDEVVLGGRRLRVLHRPGHSPADMVLHDLDNRVLVAGDHLLSRVSSNALVTRPLDGASQAGRTRPLLDYRRSLLATRELDVDLVLGGHGPPVQDHRALIDERLHRQSLRAQRILELLSNGPRTAHELALDIWGRVAFTQAYLTVSEVLGHLDLLMSDGLVTEDRSGPVIRFAHTLRKS